jgi:subtilase family serine protease
VAVKDDGVSPAATTSYQSGFNPGQLRTAYNVPANAAPAIAIVDAYANPNAQSDLNVYRSRFGLPATTIRQLRQNSTAINFSTNHPAADVGWGQEESLDLDMASAICPACQLIYVGANSANFSDLLVAEKAAHAAGAKVISNSYGGSEFFGETSTTYSSAYNYADSVVTISSGDSGYGVEFPAALAGPNIVAVGGTSLTLNSTTGARTNETVWSGAGSGCSRYIAKPNWQRDTGCARRTVADVAAVGDPATGVAVYDSYGSSAGANWFVFGGTSVAAPVIGAYYAASGVTPSATAGAVQKTYATGGLFDVRSGSNVTSTRLCGVSGSSSFYLCHAVAGFDGPTGLGTPTGPAAF